MTVARGDAPPAKKTRREAVILVSVPGWPRQDPGRLMIFGTRPTPMKAARQIKRLRRQMPEYEWSQEMLSKTEAREVKLKPFVLTDGFAEPMHVSFGRTVWTVKTVRS